MRQAFNREQLWSLTEAKVVIEDFRVHYKQPRPHSKLGYRRTAAYARICLHSWLGQECRAGSSLRHGWTSSVICINII